MKSLKMKTTHEPLSWIENTLVWPPESDLAGKPLRGFLLDFQKQIIKTILTSKGTPNKNVFMGFSRKWSKSSICEWVLLYLLTQKQGYHSAVLARHSEQAEIIFGQIKQQIEYNDNFQSEDFKCTREKVIYKPNYSSIERLYFSATGLGLLGRRLSCLVSDETGSQTDSSCYTAITSGMSFAKGGKPLIIACSNPPLTPQHWSENLVRSIKKDDDWRVFQFQADKKLDPYSPKAIAQANPMFAAYQKNPKKLKHLKPVATYLLKAAKNASKNPTDSLDYLRFQLGRKILNRETSWVNGEDLKTISLKKVLKLKTRCVIACDIALVWDICAGVVSFFDLKGNMYFWPVMHIANLNKRSTTQKKKFYDWSLLNFLTIQNKKSIDRELFINDIKSFVTENSLNPLASVWDRGLCSNEWRDSLTYGQSVLTPCVPRIMTAPISEMQAKAQAGRLYMIGQDNQAVRAFFSNVFCSAKAKNYKVMNRTSTREPIDIAVAATLSLQWILANPYRKPVIMSV